jgi:predicted metal-dependent phosphoesterase TrpH
LSTLPSNIRRVVDHSALVALDDMIDADESVDLHSHSRHSDGAWTPPELIDEAGTIGLKLISLTDHDNVGGQEVAFHAARDAGMLFLSGMEVSLTVDGRSYHVLCYDFDWSSPTWTKFAERRRERFDVFYLSLFDQMRSRGYDVDPDLARNESGHFADDPLAVALHRSGRAPTLDMARQQVRSLYLRRPVELTYQDVREFAQLLRPGEAVFSVAHPGRQELGVSVRLSEDDLRIFVETIPLVALEAHHPYHTSPDVEHYRNLAKRYGLAVTCGSDAHGQNVRRPLRKHPASMCAEFLKIIRERWAARAPVLAARS